MFVILEKRTQYFQDSDREPGEACYYHYENIREALMDFDRAQSDRLRGQHFQLIDLHRRIFCPYCGLNFQYDKYSE